MKDVIIAIGIGYAVTLVLGTLIRIDEITFNRRQICYLTPEFTYAFPIDSIACFLTKG